MTTRSVFESSIVYPSVNVGIKGYLESRKSEKMPALGAYNLL